MTAKTSNVVPLLSLEDLTFKYHKLRQREEGETKKIKVTRIEMGQVLIELRKRIEAGEIGKIKWWDWYEENIPGRSRSHAETVMALAGAENPQEAYEAHKAADRDRKKRPKLVADKASEPEALHWNSDFPVENKSIKSNGTFKNPENVEKQSTAPAIEGNDLPSEQLREDVIQSALNYVTGLVMSRAEYQTFLFRAQRHYGQLYGAGK